MRFTFVPVGVISLALLGGGTGCAGSRTAGASRAGVSSQGQRRQPVAMMAMPSQLASRCRSSTVLRSACPQRIPKVPHKHGGGLIHELVAAGPIHLKASAFAVFDLQHGAPHEQETRLNRPPAVLHLTIVGGSRPSNLFGGMTYPGSKTNAQLKNGLDTGTRRDPLLFGQRVWGGHTGALFLAASFPFGGEIGGHLSFWWRSRGRGYVVSIHAWEPLSECEDVLRRIVASTPRA